MVKELGNRGEELIIIGCYWPERRYMIKFLMYFWHTIETGHLVVGVIRKKELV